MCHFCEQKQQVQDVCETFKATYIDDTSMSLVVLVGDETDEDMQEIQDRSHRIRGALAIYGLSSHPHRGNFKPQHFITVAYNMQPGSKVSNHKH